MTNQTASVSLLSGLKGHQRQKLQKLLQKLGSYEISPWANKTGNYTWPIMENSKVGKTSLQIYS